MIYIECRNCKFVCTCCASRKDGTSCSGCENHFDEFKPAENINYCPMTGKRVISHKNISCKHVRDNGTCAKRQVIQENVNILAVIMNVQVIHKSLLYTYISKYK